MTSMEDPLLIHVQSSFPSTTASPSPPHKHPLQNHQTATVAQHNVIINKIDWQGKNLFHKSNNISNTGISGFHPPKKLKGDELLLRNLGFLEHVSAQFLHFLAKRFVTVKDVKPGSVIYFEGEETGPHAGNSTSGACSTSFSATTGAAPENVVSSAATTTASRASEPCLYLLKSGIIRLISTYEEQEIEVTKDAFFGEFGFLGLLEKRVNTAVVIGEKPASLKCLNRDAFFNCLLHFPRDLEKIALTVQGIVSGVKPVISNQNYDHHGTSTSLLDQRNGGNGVIVGNHGTQSGPGAANSKSSGNQIILKPPSPRSYTTSRDPSQRLSPSSYDSTFSQLHQQFGGGNLNGKDAASATSPGPLFGFSSSSTTSATSSKDLVSTYHEQLRQQLHNGQNNGMNQNFSSSQAGASGGPALGGQNKSRKKPHNTHIKAGINHGYG
ncbi:unnamed protein product, partial [Amoebophrya sp. A120]|eukprot:GSA120T00014203001.1